MVQSQLPVKKGFFVVRFFRFSSSGKNAKKRKKVVDAVAASLILEGYLTFKKSH